MLVNAQRSGGTVLATSERHSYCVLSRFGGAAGGDDETKMGGNYERKKQKICTYDARGVTVAIHAEEECFP